MLGIGLECGFGSAKIEFDRVCADAMKHLATTRQEDVILSIIFMSPSSLIPAAITRTKITKIDKGKPYVRAVVPVPKEAASWGRQESLDFLESSVNDVVSQAKMKLALPEEVSAALNKIVEELKTVE